MRTQVFDGQEGDMAYMRFILNRSFLTRDWKAGKNGYLRCPFCSAEGTQNHYLLECRRCKQFTVKFFKKVDE
jgi:hypothetical protein